ncbi:MAG: DUF2807 domain-containing protein [Rhodospirillaceae bacterium]|nr:DUF2807 domain-containing protein [Rhodospirillaceae bacterium]
MRATPYSLVLLITAFAAAPAWATEETRTVPAFKAVEFKGVGQVDVTAGKDQSVTLIASKKTLEQIVTEVEDGTLKIKWESARDRHSWLWRFVMPDDHDSDKVTVRITAPEVTKVGVSGAAEVNARNIDGAGVEFSVSGAAKIRANGKADRLTVNISGAGDADLDQLEVKDAVVSIAGVGKAQVNPTNTLNATIAGAGEIRYEGEPKVVSSISGAGSVRGRKK